MSFSNLTLWQIELLPWYAFLIVWLVAGFWVKTSKVTEPFERRIVHSVLFTVGFYLLFARSYHFGPLDARFAPPLFRVQVIAIVATCAGVALAIWARMMLGENWSARVTRKVGHELIRSGPYAYVRHPIYTGLLLATAGTALFLGQWKGLVALVVVLIAETFKAKREEQFMIEEFGESYRQYQSQTGFLIPGLW
jgi:protein-S-isoprenylcysteine O-methyltransferase Ste14